MKYKYSALDNSNFSWMANNNNCQTLASIRLLEGGMRCLKPFSIDFRYPISAIAGENGSGKSTLLAIAACAFHNKKNAYIPLGRKYSYYTFGDFFIQSKGELPPEGIKLEYGIRHNKWKGADPGLGYQERVKRNNGRWSNYDSRVHRQVVYCGTMRIVPHYERSAHKSCRSFFNSSKKNIELQAKVCESASRILGKDYDKFELLTWSKYGLPLASSQSLNYSGFNMGAGECSIFDILFLIYKVGKNALIIIDEIELGLHEQAQRKFVQELKQICKDQYCQIICSTHSSAILDELPPEGRFFIKNSQNKTDIVSEISIEIAMGALSGRTVSELDIFVEDQVAQTIIQTTLDAQNRKRISVIPIGSAEANLRVMASHYLEERRRCLCILDGDKSSQKQSLIGKIVNYTEAATAEQKTECRNWAEDGLQFIPGETWPESWLLNELKSISTHYEELCERIGVNSSDIISYIDRALTANKHDEFYVLGQLCGLDGKTILHEVIIFLKQNKPNCFESIHSAISKLL